MKFFRRSSSDPDSSTAEPTAESTRGSDSAPQGACTPKKGRATPRRRDVERAKGITRGPVAPAPLTRKEARKRDNQRYAGLTKEQKKAAKAKDDEERKQMEDYRRQRMAAGDEAFLLPRDKGPTRRFARDWVDAAWSPISYLFPIVLGLLIGTMIPNQTVMYVVQYLMYFFFIVLLIETIRISSSVIRGAKKQFPDAKDTGFALGWYAFMRATQPRRWRNPRPKTAPVFPWTKKAEDNTSSSTPKDKS